MTTPWPRLRRQAATLLMAALATGCAARQGGVRRLIEGYEIRGQLLSRATGQPPHAHPFVVAVRPTSGDVREARGLAVLEQGEAGFRPDFVVVPVGHDVKCVNRDSICHGFFSSSEPNAFELPVLRPGEAASFRAREPGVIHVYCSLHGGRQATILVVPTPHFAITQPSGEFAIEGLDAGTWLLETWSEGSTRTRLEVQSRPRGSRPVMIHVDEDVRGSM